MEKNFHFLSYLARLSNRRAWMSILVDSLRPPQRPSTFMCDEDGHFAFFFAIMSCFQHFHFFRDWSHRRLRNAAGGFAIRSSSN